MLRRPHRPSRRFPWFGSALIVAGVLCAASVGWAQDPYADEKTQRWAPYPAGQRTIVTSPAVGPDHTIYIAATIDTSPRTARVLAVRPNRSDKWKDPFSLESEVADISPVLSPDGSTLYIGSVRADDPKLMGGVLRAVDTETGKQRWLFDAGHDSHSIWASAAVAADGTVYVGATDDGTPSDSLVWALSPVDGSPLWFVPSAGAINVAPAIAADGTIYFAGGSLLYAVTHDGNIKWRFPLSDEIWAPPAIGADGTIYVGSNANEFVAITPEGKEKWRVPIVAGGGAAIGADETIYIGTIEPDLTGKVYALTREGKTRANWPISLPASVLTVPAIRTDGTIIFGCSDKTVRAVNADASPRWTAAVGDRVTSSPVIDTDGTIYVGAGGNLYAFHGSGAPLSEYASWPMYNRDIMHQSRAAPPVNAGILVNLATRGAVEPGTPLIAGFVLSGVAPKSLLVRAVGPGLGQYLSNPLPDPVLTIYNPTGFWAGNDDWERDNETAPDAMRDIAARVGAFPLSSGSKDAAAVTWFAPTLTYTAVVNSVDERSGVALAELYDTDLRPGSPRLINVSTRGFVGAGDNAMIGGFVIGGEGKMRVLVRGVGPGLAKFGVTELLQHPTIRVFDSTGAEIAANTGWTSENRKGDLAGAAALSGAFQLQDTSSDSAMMLSLSPGAYTVQLSGVGEETGVGLVEIYKLPH